MYVVAAFYNFCKISVQSLPGIREELLRLMAFEGMLGTAIIAQEGINGTVCGSRAAIDSLVLFFKNNGLCGPIESLSNTVGLSQMEYKEHLSKFQVFGKAKVKIKKEIVTFDPSVDPTKDKGEYILAKDWDAFVADPSTIVIDTRNDYEIQEGTFKGSIDPKTRNFVDFKAFVEEQLEDKKDAKIGMFCTGGVRCEKSTAYLKQLGFKHVYHLKGGILRYLQEMSLIDNIIDQKADLKLASDGQTCPLELERQRKLVLTQVTDSKADKEDNSNVISCQNDQEVLVVGRTRRWANEGRELVFTQVTDTNADQQHSTGTTNSSWVGKCFVFDERSGIGPQTEPQNRFNNQKVV